MWLSFLRKRTYIQANCNKCGPDKKHELLKSHSIPGIDAMDNPWWYVFEFNQCRGCGLVHMRERFIDDPERDGLPWWYYPPAITRPIPTWMRTHWKALIPLSGMIDQTYKAHQHGLNALAVMGCRSLLDVAVTNATGSYPTSFEAMLDKAKAARIIYEEDAKTLWAAFDAGSAAMHRGFMPQAHTVEQVFEIMENALQRVYVLRGTEDPLKSATPQRPPKPPKGGGATSA